MEELGNEDRKPSHPEHAKEFEVVETRRGSGSSLRSTSAKRPSPSREEHRQRMNKTPKLKLKTKKELAKEINDIRNQFSKFEAAYGHTLAYYFLKQYMKERRLMTHFDFINKVDVYRSLQKRTKKAAKSAMDSLLKFALAEEDTKSNPNSLPVYKVLQKFREGNLDVDLFDECYERVFEMLDSFYRPFLNSKHFFRFVQIMEYSKRQVKSRDYKSVAHLGQGAFGRVMAVVKKDTHALYAMKEIPKSVLRKHKTGWMCLNEMQLLSRTNSSFVLSLKYSFHSNRAVHLVFEMCMGGDLREYLEKGKFALDRTTFYAAEILLGIDHIHSLEYVYRDLKPSNILLTGTGHCKISDLGLVVKLPKLPKVLKHVAGTPGYWAPEIVSRTGTFRSSDYWSLGVLVFAMLTGKKVPNPLAEERKKNKKANKQTVSKAWSPFSPNPKEQKIAKQDPKYEHINATVKFPEAITGDVKDFISKLLAVDPKKRLGAGGLAETQKHPFFKDLNWDDMMMLKATPPFIPPKKSLDRRKKNLLKNLDFQAVKDDEKEKQFYDEFMFLNEEGFFNEVVDALEDEERLRLAGTDCCTIA
mmetsp:Transcript_9190/g.22570  ORF Transcript_9190/g.22570 Transcript_9190/m.22570 type:complete len:584 (-) Transcript_9190:171-1922(-)|eukprot:CAMPEP_0114503172 /NCGR_PEP_ID=MMETSP0109-20121206/9500_1 /TAXON_ID=29199 /ORGANISM="Chlorarachnion reptans, Strain CCCM449" /LENGTH=583 /DNA_ID=CAMNT_0001681171 /DNA_START=77 /DNA_END=1828 /DNA_ORIENTATION=+